MTLHEIPHRLSESLTCNIRGEVFMKISTFEQFGDEFVNHYIATRDWEVREHERHVTDWQMQRYFEII